MDTMGKKLRDARLSRKLTASEAAKATRIKVQHIDAMEQDNFSAIPAPAYAKGFIKLYAEYLELDTEPLLQEYMDNHAPRKRASLVADPKDRSSSKAPRTSAPFKFPSIPLPSINWTALKAKIRLPRMQWKPPRSIPKPAITIKRPSIPRPRLQMPRFKWPAITFRRPPRAVQIALLYGLGFLLFGLMLTLVHRLTPEEGLPPPAPETRVVDEPAATVVHDAPVKRPITEKSVPTRRLPVLDKLPEPYLP